MTYLCRTLPHPCHLRFQCEDLCCRRAVLGEDCSRERPRAWEPGALSLLHVRLSAQFFGTAFLFGPLLDVQASGLVPRSDLSCPGILAPLRHRQDLASPSSPKQNAPDYTSHGTLGRTALPRSLLNHKSTANGPDGEGHVRNNVLVTIETCSLIRPYGDRTQSLQLSCPPLQADNRFAKSSERRSPRRCEVSAGVAWLIAGCRLSAYARDSLFLFLVRHSRLLLHHRIGFRARGRQAAP
jgi:hypothetical protein